MANTPRQRSFVSANARATRLRHKPTKAEASLWTVLRNADGFHFRRQVPVGPLVYDFCDHGAKLLIEVDGGVHDRADVSLRDAAKDADAISRGYRVIRIANELALNVPGLALNIIQREAEQSPPTPAPSPQGGGEPHSLESHR